MLFMKVSCTLALIVLLTSAPLSKPFPCVQTTDSDVISIVDLLQMFANQPACKIYYRASASLPRFGIRVSFRIRIARKQGKSRREIYPLENETNLKSRANKDFKLVIIERLGQPSIALDPQQRTCTELPRDFNAVPFDLDTLLKGWMKESNGITFVKAGVVNIGGYQATRVKAIGVGAAGDASIYFANDPKDLLLRMEVLNTDQHEKVLMTASEISFDVPDDLFEIPNGYRRVNFDSLQSRLRGKRLK